MPAIRHNRGDAVRDLSAKRQRAWLASLNRKDIKESSYVYTCVCSDHFVDGEPSELTDNRNPDWVPSLKIGYSKGAPPSKKRHFRAQERASKRCRQEDDDRDACSLFTAETPAAEAAHNVVDTEISIQTDLTCADVASMEDQLMTTKLQLENACLRVKHCGLQQGLIPHSPSFLENVCCFINVC